MSSNSLQQEPTQVAPTLTFEWKGASTEKQRLLLIHSEPQREENLGEASAGSLSHCCRCRPGYVSVTRSRKTGQRADLILAGFW